MDVLDYVIETSTLWLRHLLKGWFTQITEKHFSHVTLAVSAQIVWVLFSQISEISVSENNTSAPKLGRWILFLVLKVFQTFPASQKHCPCYWFTDLTVNHFSKCFFFFFLAEGSPYKNYWYSGTGVTLNIVLVKSRSSLISREMTLFPFLQIQWRHS